ncbi:MAG: OmpA family protein [Geminicoccaceae bacterium]
MEHRSRTRRGRSGLKTLLLAGCCLTLAGLSPAHSTPLSFAKTLARGPASPIVPVQDSTQPAADAAGQESAQAAGTQEPVSANDLKAAINAIKERLARQQEGRATTGTSELAAELKNARQTIADLTDSLSRLRGERDSILAEMKNLTEELGRRDDRIAALQTEMASQTADAKTRLGVVEGELETAKSERDALRGEAAEAGRRLENALNEIDDLTETVQQAWADRDAVEQSLKEAREQATSELSTRDTALSDAQAKLADLEAQLSAKLAEQDRLGTEMANVRKALAEQTTAAELQASEAQALTDQLAERDNQLAERAKLLEAAEARGVELLARSQQIEREAEGRLRERTQTLTSNLENANTRVETLETEIQGLREVATASVAEVETLGQQVLDLLQENEVLVSALTEVRASKVLLDEELAAARNDVSVYSADAAQLREEVTKLQNGTAATAASGDAAGDEAQAQKLAEAQAEIERLTEELLARESDAAQAQGSGADNGSNDRIAALEAELAASENARSSLETELAALREQPAQIEPAAAPADLPADTGAGDNATPAEPQQGAALERIEAASPEIVIASAEPIAEIDAFLGELNAVETQDGWLMTVPDGIVFAPGSDELAVEASPALAKIASLVNYYGDSAIRIVGHTDSFGDAAVNRDLSLRRANSVRDFLASNYGIAPDRIVTEGLGEDAPIASNDTISGRRANRRVEVPRAPLKRAAGFSRCRCRRSRRWRRCGARLPRRSREKACLAAGGWRVELMSSSMGGFLPTTIRPTMPML